MSTLSEQRLAEFRVEFQRDALGRSATAALLRLAARGCDPTIVQAYAGRAAGYKSGNLGPVMHRRGPQETARQLRGIKRQFKKLAKRTADLRGIWGFWSRMVEADCIHIPEELEEIAGHLSRVRVKGYANWHPQRGAILDLLDHVRSSTGRYHYAEVSILINAEIAWRALKRGEAPPEITHDVDSLKMIVQRWRRERRAKLSKSADPGTEHKDSFDASSQLNSSFPPSVSP